MSTTTEDRRETPETAAEDRLPYHPEDWPDEFRAFLDRLPNVDQELSDIISEMEGLLALADTALLIHMNACQMPGEPEAGELDYRKARMISPMREEVAGFVWQLYTRVDAFYDILQKYQRYAQEEALKLAAAARDGGVRSNGEAPQLTLDEEDLWGLLEDLAKMGASADLVAHFEVDEGQTKNISAAVGALAEKVGDRLRRAAGIPIDDETDQRLHDQATAWRNRAEKLGPDAVESEGAPERRAPDQADAEGATRPDLSRDLDQGLAWEAITVLALAERLAFNFGHRFVGKRMMRELEEVRHRIEDHIGVDGKLSDGIVDHAGDRYDAIKREARGVDK